MLQPVKLYKLLKLVDIEKHYNIIIIRIVTFENEPYLGHVLHNV
jgi:hypothetical protein